MFFRKSEMSCDKLEFKKAAALKLLGFLILPLFGYVVTSLITIFQINFVIFSFFTSKNLSKFLSNFSQLC